MEHFDKEYWATIDKAYKESAHYTDSTPPVGMIRAANGDWVVRPEPEMCDSADSNGETDRDTAQSMGHLIHLLAKG